FATNFVPPPTRTGRVVATVHDLAFRRFPETAPQAVTWWRDAVLHTVRRASRLIAPSEWTKRDLLELYGALEAKVAVIPLAVDCEMYRPPSEERILEVRRAFGIDGPYLVALGRGPRKNLPRLLAAFAALPGDIRPRLVIAGAREWSPDGLDPGSDALRALPRDVRAAVTLVGYLPEAEKVALLGAAIGLAFPSLYEGFGFPVLEAMACGTPVLTSDASSLPDLAGSGATRPPTSNGCGLKGTRSSCFRPRTGTATSGCRSSQGGPSSWPLGWPLPSAGSSCISSPACTTGAARRSPRS